jgi:multidrug transporter EmrE-like cation transporter
MTAPVAVGSAAWRARAWVMLALAIVLLNTGNLVLDLSFKGRPLSLALFLSPGFAVAIGCLAVSFFCYVRALARLPLAVAYPVMVGLSLLIVAVIGYLWRGADLNLVQLLGMLIVFAGVTLISSASRNSAEREVS